MDSPNADTLVAIKDYENYFINRNGEIYSLQGKKKLRKLKPYHQSNKYLTVYFMKNGKKNAKTVHRLLAMTFLENNDPDKCEVDHINRIKTDNRLDNLRWVTRKVNATNKLPKGTICYIKELNVKCYRARYNHYNNETKEIYRRSKYFSSLQEAEDQLISWRAAEIRIF